MGRSTANQEITAKVRMYTTRFCSFCIRARMLLNEKGVEYQDISVDSDAQLRREMESLSGSHLVPQIWIDDRHVGGFNELRALDMSGELDDLLN